jgi:hypothetical protein
MTSWRDQILAEFTPNVARLTLVADPDGLLLEEGILEGIRQRGFELIPFEDPIAFRYAYESKFRSRWDRGEATDLVVVLRSETSDLASLPHDLLQSGRKLAFNLGDIFPNLSYPVVAELDRGDLDALYNAQDRHAPGRLGVNATKEFVLRHVFEIAPELIKGHSDLLRALLRRHYRHLRIPAALDERFIQLLRQDNAFDDWPLETIVPDRDLFFAFLQERWPIFLDRTTQKEPSAAHEDKDPYGLTIDGPVDLPFDHHDIRVYIDNLFLEGLLQPVPYADADDLSKTWVGIGIQTDPSADRWRRIQKLIDNLHGSLPPEDSRHGDWFHFARAWSELKLLLNQQSDGPPEGLHDRIKDLEDHVDDRFAAWILKRYAGLINLPPVPPVMLHHLPRFLSRQLAENRIAKVALIVVDGLSLDQWLAVREELDRLQARFRCREGAVFAWMPSLTSVSRQAAFAGKTPIFFPDSIHSTDKEPALWHRFWGDEGLTPKEVVYRKGLGNGDLTELTEALSHPKVRTAGLVIDKVDKIMHGMQMGSAGMHSQVRQWSRQPYLRSLLNCLLDGGYRIYLTSDHGNIEAKGCGRPAEGAVADLRGERVRVFSDAGLREKVKERFPSSLEWPPVGLPEDYLPLIAPTRRAFVNEKHRIVSHGGLSVEELIVPLIQIERQEL